MCYTWAQHQKSLKWTCLKQNVRCTTVWYTQYSVHLPSLPACSFGCPWSDRSWRSICCRVGVRIRRWCTVHTSWGSNHHRTHCGMILASGGRWFTRWCANCTPLWSNRTTPSVTVICVTITFGLLATTTRVGGCWPRTGRRFWPYMRKRRLGGPGIGACRAVLCRRVHSR